MLKLREDGQREVHGTTKNVSEIGLLLITDSEVPEGTAVELTLTLLEDDVAIVCLVGSGRVIRVERGLAGPAAIAVECDHVLEQRQLPMAHREEIEDRMIAKKLRGPRS